MEGGDGTAGSVRTQGRRRGLRVGVAVLAAAGLGWFLVVERDQVLAAVDLLVGADPVWIAVGSVSSILSIVLFAAVRSVLVGASGARFRLGRATTASFASGAIATTLPAGGAIATGYMVQRYREAGADMVFMDGLKTRDLVERAARDLDGIPQLLNSWLVTPDEAQAMGFAVYIHLGVMLRHFHDIRVMLGELRDTGRVTVPPEDLSVEPITRLLSGDA